MCHGDYEDASKGKETPINAGERILVDKGWLG